MAKTVAPEDLTKAIEEELKVYREGVTERINNLSNEAVKSLVKKTRETAPKRTGSFRGNIASKVLEKNPRGNRYVWYVKAPDHRKTHLLVHGHAKKNGGRVPGDPFLENAMADVLPAYEKAVKEAIEHD